MIQRAKVRRGLTNNGGLGSRRFLGDGAFTVPGTRASVSGNLEITVDSANNIVGRKVQQVRASTKEYPTGGEGGHPFEVTVNADGTINVEEGRVMYYVGTSSPLVQNEYVVTGSTNLAASNGDFVWLSCFTQDVGFNTVNGTDNLDQFYKNLDGQSASIRVGSVLSEGTGDDIAGSLTLEVVIAELGTEGENLVVENQYLRADFQLPFITHIALGS